jgi:hypothetical protein
MNGLTVRNKTLLLFNNQRLEEAFQWFNHLSSVDLLPSQSSHCYQTTKAFNLPPSISKAVELSCGTNRWNKVVELTKFQFCQIFHLKLLETENEIPPRFLSFPLKALAIFSNNLYDMKRFKLNQKLSFQMKCSRAFIKLHSSLKRQSISRGCLELFSEESISVFL